jgi:DHA2 family multidrug resistance protein
MFTAAPLSWWSRHDLCPSKKSNVRAIVPDLWRAMSVFHLMRNIGSSFFISISVAEIVRATAQNYARMNEMLSPFHNRLALPRVMGGWTVESQSGLAGLVKAMNRQASMIGYLNAFTMYTAASGVGVVLVMTMTRGRRGPG